MTTILVLLWEYSIPNFSPHLQPLRYALHFTAPLPPFPQSESIQFPDIPAHPPVVGYMEKDTPSSGKTMIAPMFLNTTDSTLFKLSDLRGGKYEDETAGDFYFTVLNTSGSAATFTADDGVPEYVGLQKKFYWWEDEDHEAGWYDIDGEFAWDASKVVFKPGDGFWTYGGDEVTLVPAGTVGKSDVVVTTPSSGKVGSGNPFPMSINLSQFYCKDYPDGDETAGDFYITILNPSGSAKTFTADDGITEYIGKQKKFYWWEDEDHEAGWYDIDGEFTWDGTKISIPAGEGFWMYGGTIKLVIPAPAVLQ